MSNQIQFGSIFVAAQQIGNLYYPKSVLAGADGTVVGVDGLGHLDVIAHAHEEGGYALFEKDISASADFIFIDLSDTTNYPHDNTDWIHVSNLIIDIDASNTADYQIDLGFLSNVDGSNGDFHHVYEWKGSKTAGRRITEVIATNPESVKMRAATTIGTVDLNQAAFQTDVNLASTRDPTTTDTPSGNGDVVLRVTINAGEISLGIGMVYHSH